MELSDHLSQALQEERRENALKLNRFRLAGVVVFRFYSCPSVLFPDRLGSRLGWKAIAGGPEPRLFSDFSVALFVCLLMLSAHTSRARNILVSLGGDSLGADP